MKNVFDIPKSLLEAIHVVSGNDMTSWRRDLDADPLVTELGLNWPTLSEVYHGSIEQFDTNVDHDAIHDMLKVPGKPTMSTKMYTNDSSINSVLWNHYMHDTPLDDGLKREITQIESDLYSKDIPHGLTLYSGFKRSPAHLSAMQWNSSRPIKLMHLPAFTSTSTDFSKAVIFSAADNETQHHESDHHGVILPGAKHIAQLHLAPNKKHQLASTMRFSAAPREREILLSRGHTFELHPRPTLINPGSSSPVYVWKATNGEVAWNRKEIK